HARRHIDDEARDEKRTEAWYLATRYVLGYFLLECFPPPLAHSPDDPYIKRIHRRQVQASIFHGFRCRVQAILRKKVTAFYLVPVEVLFRSEVLYFTGNPGAELAGIKPRDCACPTHAIDSMLPECLYVVSQWGNSPHSGDNHSFHIVHLLVSFCLFNDAGGISTPPA